MALANAVDAKDPITEHHCDRVAEQAISLARAAGLSAEEIEAVGYGAVLHDVGKIGIAESVLTKPGELTDDERAEMQRHPVIGADILRPLRLGGLVGPIVRGHHERWDGGGYPDGLRGEAIPIGARIVSVVDAYDAMTHDRPYRSRLSDDEARKELIRHRRTQFDRRPASTCCSPAGRRVRGRRGAPSRPTRDPPGARQRRMNPITVIVELLFGILFVATLSSYVRRRDALSRDVMLIFASLAGLFVVAGIAAFGVTLPDPVTGAALALLLAQPVLTLRLAHRLHRSPNRARSAPRRLAATALPMIVLPFRKRGRWCWRDSRPSSSPTCSPPSTWAGRHGAGSARPAFGSPPRLPEACSWRWRWASRRRLRHWPWGCGAERGRIFGLLAAVLYIFAFLPPSWARNLGAPFTTFKFTEGPDGRLVRRGRYGGLDPPRGRGRARPGPPPRWSWPAKPGGRALRADDADAAECHLERSAGGTRRR